MAETSMESQPPSDIAGGLLRDAAKDVDRAARHSLIAAGHIEQRKGRRMDAHAWAARGHIVTALAHLDQAAQLHARMSSLPKNNSG